MTNDVPQNADPWPKRVGEEDGISLPSVELYLEDLKAIDATFQELPGETIYRTGGYEYSSLQQMIDHATSPLSILYVRSLKLHEVSGASVNFRENHVQIYLSDDSDLVLKGAAAQFKSLLEPRAISSSVWNGPPSIIHLSPKPPAPLALPEIPVLQLPVINVLPPAPTQDTRNFWERNRDQIILAVIVAVLSVISTLTVVWITK